NPAAAAQAANVDLRQVRLLAEAVETDRYFKTPPLHANAAAVILLAARRYDVLARTFQIDAEVRAMYADAIAHAATDRDRTLRDLFWSRYWMWELRDAYEELAPLYARAWKYESRDGHLDANLERYHLAAQQAIRDADAFYGVTRQYLQTNALPPFSSVVSPKAE
ncbi:MAG: hypothetical protein WA814_03360, partial [Candidatus Baltobacteraceae bacterium]